MLYFIDNIMFTINDELYKKYPTFSKTVNYLFNEKNFYRKTIPNLISSNFDFALAERICENALIISNNNWETYKKRVNNLTHLSLEFLTLQAQLEKTGKYKHSSFQEVKKFEYTKSDLDNDGPDYLWGLYFSEVFWKIHYNFVIFFLHNFATNLQPKGNFLEIPLGTSFFACEFLRINPNWTGIGIDIADTSINFSNALLQVNKIPTDSLQIKKIDFFKYDETKKFDRICCGEFLEHLENPLEALTKLSKLLSKNGKLFITVAVWAAGIDHIFLYKNAEEVREQIKSVGFNIEKELVQSVFEQDEENPEKEKIPVSYAAILTKSS